MKPSDALGLPLLALPQPFAGLVVQGLLNWIPAPAAAPRPGLYAICAVADLPDARHDAVVDAVFGRIGHAALHWPRSTDDVIGMAELKADIPSILASLPAPVRFGAPVPAAFQAIVSATGRKDLDYAWLFVSPVLLRPPRRLVGLAPFSSRRAGDAIWNHGAAS